MGTRLYNQTLAHRFGTELIACFAEHDWTHFEFAVAWVRQSGIRHLQPALVSYLSRGGVILGTVGIDIENTSLEGLRSLLNLARHGNAQFFVYHNEAVNTTFHPKLYLLKSPTRARLIVGSSNLTQAGLYTNTEAGLQVDAKPTTVMIREVRLMLQAWRDVSQGIIRFLDDDLLNQLITQDYVKPESVLSKRRAASAGYAKRKRTRLFVARSVSPPPAIPVPHVSSGRTEGTVLMMRVRRASATSRRTQIQIPIRVRRLAFFNNTNSVKSRITGQSHQLREAKARGGVNTIKLEIPEINRFEDPVIRFEREGTDIHYVAYDASSAEGHLIMSALKAGRHMASNATVLTRPDNPESSTWYRFV